MEVIAIDKKTVELIIQKFDEFAKRIKTLCGKQKTNEKWMDNEDVCRLLNISKRTLQSYRDRKILPFSQIGHKCYYRISDIENLLAELSQKNT